jgi:DNA-binding transcriptional ArsR family regulator
MLIPHDDGPVFRALADPTRRRVLDILRKRPGLSVTVLGASFAMSRIGVTKHLRVLAQAELVVSRPSGSDGRARELYLNVVPLHRIVRRWSTQLDALFASQALALRDLAEGPRRRAGRPRRAARRVAS